MNCGGVPSLPRSLMWQPAQLPFSGSSNSSSPRCSAAESVAAAGKVGIVLAAVWIERPPVLLEHLEGLEDRIEDRAPVLKDRSAEDRPQVFAIARLQNARHDRVRARVRHLEGRQQRDARLGLAAVDPAVPGEAAGRPVVDALVGVVLAVEKVLRERRYRLQIGDRRHRPEPGLAQIAAAELDRSGVGWAEAVPGIVAGGAGLPAGCRQPRIEEQRPPERRQPRRLPAHLGPVDAGSRDLARRQPRGRRHRERGAANEGHEERCAQGSGAPPQAAEAQPVRTWNGPGRTQRGWHHRNVAARWRHRSAGRPGELAPTTVIIVPHCDHTVTLASISKPPLVVFVLREETWWISAPCPAWPPAPC